MIKETITFNFKDEAQQRRFHMALDGEGVAVVLAWQPIETAPMGKALLGEDGPCILLGWNNNIHVVIGRYERLGWTDGYGGAIHDPTHWMPLPESPKP